MSEAPHTADLGTRYRYRREGAEAERERIIGRLNDYFELTLMPGDDGLVSQNQEWDSGFQAAIALIKGEQK